MKNILLVNPRGNIFGKNEKMSNFLQESEYMESFKLLWSGPNLGLLTLAALFPEDWECTYIDENYRSIDSTKEYDIVFLSAMTQQIVRAYEIADYYKAKNIFTVIGGIHVSTLPEDAQHHVDVVLSGEAENVWFDFYSDYCKGSCKKIYIPKKNTVYQFEIPLIPRYDLLMDYNYPLITVQTTRGCPHNCSFCAASKVFGNKYRRKSNEQIIREFTLVKKLFPDRLILFADDNAFVYTSLSIELLKQLEELSIRFIAQVDISIANKTELLKAMAKAGCQWVVIGFESVNVNSLYELDDINWKYKQSKNYPALIRSIQSFGIGIYGTFIIGLDCDNINIFQDTAQFIIDNQLYSANITVPTPLPGTKMRTQMQEKGRILDYGWDYYTLWDVVVKFTNFTKEEIEDGLVQLYKKINSEENIKKRLAHLKQLAKNRNVVLAEK
ncbi:radical SAM superfamily enzyme YgiQ (UPF0313 family) [Lachnotalea glycerini]|uniref:Radical SAM superfamily enzyme YgiQ (UPF0313 family) n=1 Tax=Lachnotalea glycerini TaxID=1763509 RepID=A0A318F110_9FIRM|nr:radical SAM protein [Lachnotalea glycerini]PXV95578.1 radical SAM superfamily enzyme YgiQ (UPF0313 family) [Lachnotalea glycerini]